MFGKLQNIVNIIFNKTNDSIEDFTASFDRYQVDEGKKVKHIASKPKPQIRELSEEKSLQLRKKKLIKELETVESDLQKVKTKLHESRSKKNESASGTYFDPEAVAKAAQLVARMNQQRRQKSEADRMNSQKMEIRLKSSLKMFKEMNERQQKQKEEKHKKIEERMQKRKENFKILSQIGQKSDAIINELQNYRVSLPIITKYKNPEQLQNQFEGLLKKKQKKSPTTPQKSPFIDKIKQQQLNKKRQQYLKNYEKKRIRERQQLYGQKVRKNQKQSAMFITQ